MRITEALGWIGRVRVVVRDKDGRMVDEWEGKNLITDAGKNLLRDILSGAVTDGEIKYLAVGAGSTPPSASDVALADERFRKQITKQINTGAPGELKTITYIAPFECNDFAIAELGWFAGPNATATPGSGILVARVLYSRAKTALESLQIERTDSIG